MSTINTAAPHHSTALLRKKTELVYAAIGPSVVANALAVGLLTVMLHELVPATILQGMGIAMAIVLGLRYANYRAWKHQPVTDDKLEHWANRYTLTLGMNSAIWTIYAAWVAQTGELTLIVLSSFIILGVAVGGLANATMLRVIYSFSLPPMIAFGGVLIFQDMPHAITLSLATILEIVYIGSMARVISRTIDTSLSTEFEKEFLQTSVEHANTEQINAVQQLEWEIEQHLQSQQQMQTLTSHLQQQHLSAERFESLFAKLSQTLYEITQHNSPAQIDQALNSIGNDFQLDCIIFCQINKNDVHIRHSWTNQHDHCPLVQAGQSIRESLPWLSHSFQQGYIRQYRAIQPLASLAPIDHQILTSSGVRSILTMPLGQQTSTHWGIGYATTRRYEEWSDETLRRLRALGELLLHAILSFNTRQALYQSEQLFGAIFKQSPYGMAILHTDGRLHQANQRFCEMFELDERPPSPGTLIKLRSRLNPDSQIQLKADMQALTRGDKQFVNHQTELTLANKTSIHLNANLSRILNQNQQTEFIILVTEDISEKQKLQNRNDSIARELEHTQRNAMMGELSASLAHELNQPLTAITNNAEFLKLWLEKLPGIHPENRQQLEELSNDLINDAIRAGEVIRRIRAMTQPQPASREPIDLKQLIKQVLELVNSELIIHKCRVSTSLGTKLPPVWGDAIQLQQVLINLLINSIEAGEEKPDTETTIKIETFQLTPDSVCIVVLDNGPGFDNAITDQLFNAFYTNKKTGMGMGLAIARSIVETHGGTLSAETLNTGGARFEIHLPLTTEYRTSATNTFPETAQ